MGFQELQSREVIVGNVAETMDEERGRSRGAASSQTGTACAVGVRAPPDAS